MATEYLSNDLITEILKRLSVKSLVRFRGVCKSWQSLISSEEFIGTHLKQQQSHTLTTFDPLLAFDHHPDYVTNRFCLVRCNHLHSPHSSFQIYPPVGRRYFDAQLFGFCDGIICLLCSETTIMICNPSIRKSAAISVPEINYFPDLVYYGFGHDDCNNDYKIVRLCCKNNTSDVNVHVYSLKSLTWKVIVNDLLNIRCLRDRSFLAGGHVHWVANSGEPDGPLLLSFDLTNEVFRQMELPLRSHPLLFAYHLLPTATKHGKVSLLAWNEEKNMSSVWELGELGVPGSWMELHSIEEPVYSAMALENSTSTESPDGTRRLVIHSFIYGGWDSTELESGIAKHHSWLELFDKPRCIINGFANYMESLVMLNYDNTTCTTQSSTPSSMDNYI